MVPNTRVAEPTSHTSLASAGRLPARRIHACSPTNLVSPARPQYPTRANVMQQLMYRLGMAERIHLGASAGQQRGVEELALAGARTGGGVYCMLNALGGSRGAAARRGGPGAGGREARGKS